MSRKYEEQPFEKVPEDRTAVDNILRVNHGNQMRLGLMADAKANIMITVSSIVFSVTLANLDNEVMKWPLLTFAANGGQCRVRIPRLKISARAGNIFKQPFSN